MKKYFMLIVSMFLVCSINSMVFADQIKSSKAVQIKPNPRLKNANYIRNFDIISHLEVTLNQGNPKQAKCYIREKLSDIILELPVFVLNRGGDYNLRWEMTFDADKTFKQILGLSWTNHTESDGLWWKISDVKAGITKDMWPLSKWEYRVLIEENGNVLEETPWNQISVSD